MAGGAWHHKYIARLPSLTTAPGSRPRSTAQRSLDQHCHAHSPYARDDDIRRESAPHALLLSRYIDLRIVKET
jgi:hypothetical protein